MSVDGNQIVAYQPNEAVRQDVRLENVASMKMLPLSNSQYPMMDVA